MADEWNALDLKVRNQGFGTLEVRGELYTRVMYRGWIIAMKENPASVLVIQPGLADPHFSTSRFELATGWVDKQGGGDFTPKHPNDAIDDLLDTLNSVSVEVDQHEYGMPTRTSEKEAYGAGHLNLRRAVLQWLEEHSLSVEYNDENSWIKFPAKGRAEFEPLGYVSNVALSSFHRPTTKSIKVLKEAPSRKSHLLYIVKDLP